MPCSVDECPWRYLQVFSSDLRLFDRKHNIENENIFVSDWRFVTVEDYIKETAGDIIFEPYAKQFYEELKRKEVDAIINDTCVSEAFEAMKAKEKARESNERINLSGALCEKMPPMMPGYKRPSKQMHSSRPVLRIETVLQECSPEERLIWDGFYGRQTCIKYYQYGEVDDDYVFVDLFLPDAFPVVGSTGAARMTYWRFPWVPQEGITFVDEPTADCTNPKNEDICPWRGTNNTQHTQVSYPADGRFLEDLSSTVKKGAPVYPGDFYDVSGAMAFEFTAEDGTFYCKDVYNTTNADNCDLSALDDKIKEFISGGGSTGTGGCKTFLVPARTNKELISFIDAAQSGNLSGMSTIVSSPTADIWYKNMNVKERTDSCERKIVGPEDTEIQGYWDGTIKCPKLACQSSITITATRQCMRSTGVFEDCETCVKDNPDMYIPEPINPEGNIHKDDKGKCVFQRTCTNPTPCVSTCDRFRWEEIANNLAAYGIRLGQSYIGTSEDGYYSTHQEAQQGRGSSSAYMFFKRSDLNRVRKEVKEKGILGTIISEKDLDCLSTPVIHVCLPSKAQIAMADGSVKAIVDVRDRDMVMGFNLSEPKAALKPAKVKKMTITGDMEYMRINNLEITSAHPVLLSDGKLVRAGEIKVGDKLVKADGKIEEVKTIEPKAGKSTVYNLFLEGGDGFVADGIRVIGR